VVTGREALLIGGSSDSILCKENERSMMALPLFEEMNYMCLKAKWAYMKPQNA
jgi:hypothetical protein